MEFDLNEAVFGLVVLGIIVAVLFFVSKGDERLHELNIKKLEIRQVFLEDSLRSKNANN